MGKDAGRVGEERPAVDACVGSQPDLAYIGVDLVLPVEGDAVHSADPVGPLEIAQDEALSRRGRGRKISDENRSPEQGGRVELQAGQDQSAGGAARPASEPKSSALISQLELAR